MINYMLTRFPLGLLLLLIFFISCSTAQPHYTLVVYNVENLFDADGYAVFDDYKPFDEDGNPNYTPAHVLTKLQNTAKLMSRYNDGAGPDIILMSEVESDFTPLADGQSWDIGAFRAKFGNMTLEYMLGDGLSDEIIDLPSELLLLKAFEEAGIEGYEVISGYDRDENLRPNHVQKNVIFTRLPVHHERTKVHVLEQARPILEVWVDVDGHELALFANHWKSRASDAEIERIRVQNGRVLKARLDELRSENPQVDFILGGDFNSDYNQSHRYPYMDTTGVNDVLKSVGDERAVKNGNTDAVYNLWYEYDINKRGSDTFRGFWGTLMQIMISPGMYDFNGIQYVDNSFDVGRFYGKNVYSNSGAPRRWNSFENGGGYSDHLPISMNLTTTPDNNTEQRITLENPGVNDDEEWSVIPVSYTLPDSSEVIMPHYYENSSIRTSDYFDELFFIETTINDEFEIYINDEQYDLYAPAFRVSDRFSNVAGTDSTVRFIGRLGIFRGNWQFVIEDESYINPEW